MFKSWLCTAVLKYNKKTSARHYHLKMKHPLPTGCTTSDITASKLCMVERRTKVIFPNAQSEEKLLPLI